MTFKWENLTPEEEADVLATADMGEMYRAPAEVMGIYSCLDAEACWLLWHEVLKPAAAPFQYLQEYLAEYPDYIYLLIRQKHRGMLVNRKKLEEYRDVLRSEIHASTRSLFTSPLVEPHIRAFNGEVVALHESKEPGKYLKASLPDSRKEPHRLTKKGTVNRAWLAWDEKQRQPPVLSKTWLNWGAKRVELEGANHFNVNSGDDKRWLLFERLGYKPVGFTDSGLASTDYDAMLGFGEVGKLFNDIADKEKLAQFCDQILGLLWTDDTLHPGFLTPGTLTGRLSGKKPNIQQMPKDLRLLACFQARPGYKLITCDVVSLENYVMAELSRDASLWELYGPDARPGQCAYLFNAAHLPVVGPRIRAKGYNPRTAMPSDTKKAKAESKPERAIGKVITLSANYGAGASKMHETMKLQGAEVTLEEAQQMHAAFWQLYKGIKDWERELQRQYRKNRGWVLNGVGRPLPVSSDYIKDLVNRVCQSTGHDAFIKKLMLTVGELDAAGLDWHPWIADLHDCEIYEVRDKDVAAAIPIIEKLAYDKLNAWLGGAIPLKGEAKVCDTWSHDKIETEADEVLVKEFLA